MKTLKTYIRESRGMKMRGKNGETYQVLGSRRSLNGVKPTQAYFVIIALDSNGNEVMLDPSELGITQEQARKMKYI